VLRRVRDDSIEGVDIADLIHQRSGGGSIS
jgi:hypothetical protein